MVDLPLDFPLDFATRAFEVVVEVEVVDELVFFVFDCDVEDETIFEFSSATLATGRSFVAEEGFTEEGFAEEGLAEVRLRLGIGSVARDGVFFVLRAMFSFDLEVNERLFLRFRDNFSFSRGGILKNEGERKRELKFRLDRS